MPCPVIRLHHQHGDHEEGQRNERLPEDDFDRVNPLRQPRHRDLPDRDPGRGGEHQQITGQRLPFAGEVLRKEDDQSCVDDRHAQHAAPGQRVAGNEEVGQQDREDRVGADQHRGVADAGVTVAVVAGCDVARQQQPQRAQEHCLAPRWPEPHAQHPIGDEHHHNRDQQPQHRQPQRMRMLQAELDRRRTAAPQRRHPPRQQVRPNRRLHPDARLRAVGPRRRRTLCWLRHPP